MFAAHGMGVAGGLIAAGFGAALGGASPVVPAPSPPVPVVASVGGGGGGGGGGVFGGSKGYFTSRVALGPIDSEDVQFQLGMLYFDPLPIADGFGIDPEAEGAESSTDITGPPLEKEPTVQPAPRIRRAPSKKKPTKKTPIRRVGNVAMGIGRLYVAGRGVQRVADALSAGDLVGAAKHAVKFAALRGLFRSGVSSVLDGIDPEGEDGRKKKGG